MQYGLGLRPHLSHSIPCPVRGVKGWLDGVINWNRGSGVWGKGMRDAGAGVGGWRTSCAVKGAHFVRMGYAVSGVARGLRHRHAHFVC